MTSRVDPILDLIDTALADPGQHSPESDQYLDVAPTMPAAGTCWRCTTTPAADGSELCAGCRSYLLEDSEHDPTQDAGWWELPPGVVSNVRYAPGRQVAPAGPGVLWTSGDPIIITADPDEPPDMTWPASGPVAFSVTGPVGHSNLYERFAEARRHGQPLELRLTALGDRVMGFLGDRLIRACTVTVDTTHEPSGLPWTMRPPELDVTHITIDGYRFLAQLDVEGVLTTHRQRECGRRTFFRLSAVVTPVEGPAIDIVGQEHVTLRGPGSGFPWADGDRIAITWGEPADLARLDFEEALQRLQDATGAPLDTLRAVLQDTIDKIGLSPHAAADSLIRLSSSFAEPSDDPPPPGPRNRAERRADRFGRQATVSSAGPRPAWTHRVAR